MAKAMQEKLDPGGVPGAWLVLHGEVSGSEGASLDTVVLGVLKIGCVECCNSEQSCVIDPVGADQTCTAGGFIGKAQRG